MLPAPIPDNEAERLASLQRMLLLATPDEEIFDRITRVTQRLFATPIALVSLIDANRQWFKSCIGLPVRETGRDVSFCGHAILDDSLFVIEDALADPRFADNPLVVNEPRVIFYAGRPLRNSAGHAIGTLCIIDHQPRRFSQAERQLLDDLGHWVEQVLLCRELSEAQREALVALDETRRNQMLDPQLNIWTSSAIHHWLEQEVRRAFVQHSWLGVLAIEVSGLDSIPPPCLAGILNESCRRLRAVLHGYDSLGRLNTDTLLALVPGQAPGQLTTLRHKIKTAIELPFLVGEQIFELRCRTGLATADFIDSTPEANTLLAACLQSLQSEAAP